MPACTARPDLAAPYAAPAATPPPPPFRLAPGADFTAEFCRLFQQVEEYRLGVGDRLEIHVHQLPELTATTLVAPDGTISYFRVGAIAALGRTANELRDDLQSRLTAHYPEPIVSVILIEVDARTERFVEMLLRSSEGARRDLTVGSDGRASLPGVGSVDLLGLELSEAETLINARLQASYPSLQVVLNSEGTLKSRYSVLGEVNKPGLYDLENETTLVEALAAAGGETEYADLGSVLLMSRTADGGVDALLYSLEDAFAHGNSLPMVRVRPGDTLLVLPTGIRDVNRFFEQYVQRNVPIRVGANYQLNQPQR